MYHDVHGSPKTGIPPLVASWSSIRSIQAIERFITGLVHSYETRQRRRAAIHDLRRFDDRVLRDLGIERGQIQEVADGQMAANRRLG